MYVGWRSAKKASFRTPDGIETIDLSRPSGKVKFKIIHVEK